MQLIGLACVVAYCVVATTVAVRMLRLASRTGGLPELFIGSALLLGGAIGFPPLVLAPLLGSSQPELALRLGLAGVTGLHLSAWANLLGWRVIFHAQERWARTAVFACSALLFVSLIHRLGAVSVSLVTGDRSAEFATGYRACLVVMASPYLLMAISGFLYHAKVRRRLSLGLADPVVVNRIALWSWTSAVVCMQYAFSLATISLRQLPEWAATYQIVVAALGLSLSVLLYLAFLPPKAYLRRISRRGATATPAGA